MNCLPDAQQYFNRLIIKGIWKTPWVRIYSLMTGFGSPIATLNLQADQSNGGSLVGLASFGLAGRQEMETSTPYEP